jgi:GMP synthase-like glutamine amidotransferase
VILIIDLCYRESSLSHDEFVTPIASIVRKTGITTRVIHYTRITPEDAARVRGIILCGTALKDNAFAERPEVFSWISGCSSPVLGICAGMQVLSLVFGGSLVQSREIGMKKVSVIKNDPLIVPEVEFEAYELHNFSVVPPDSFSVLAGSDECIQVMKHHERPIWGVMFHPEVRNEWVVENFVCLSGPGLSRD